MTAAGGANAFSAAPPELLQHSPWPKYDADWSLGSAGIWSYNNNQPFSAHNTLYVWRFYCLPAGFHSGLSLQLESQSRRLNKVRLAALSFNSVPMSLAIAQRASLGEKRQLTRYPSSNQRCWFHASHKSARTAGVGCRLSTYEFLYISRTPLAIWRTVRLTRFRLMDSCLTLRSSTTKGGKPQVDNATLKNA